MRRMVACWAWILAAAAPAVNAPAPLNALGDPKAPVMIEVFSDFQCPGCKAFYDDVLRPLRRDYVSAGKVYLVHHEFPWPYHAYARLAAMYAYAAGRVGRYEAASDALFGNQAVWSASGKVDETVCAVLTAEQARKVRALVKDPATAAAVAREAAAGQAAGIKGTPTVWITHKLRRQAIGMPVKYELLRKYLDALLAK